MSATLRSAFFDGPAGLLAPAPPRFPLPPEPLPPADSGSRGPLGERGLLVLVALVVGPAQVVGAQGAVLDRDRPRADRLEQRPVVRDQDHGALEGEQRVLERLAALEVEMVGRLVEDQDVGAGGDEDRQRQAPLLAAGDVGQALVDVGPAEEEVAEQVADLLAAEPGAALRCLDHRARPRGRVGVLGEIAEVDVVADLDRARRRLALARQRLDQARLAGAVGTDEDDVLTALEPHRGVVEQDPAGHLDPGALELEREAAGALGLGERERRACARRADRG